MFTYLVILYVNLYIFKKLSAYTYEGFIQKKQGNSVSGATNLRKNVNIQYKVDNTLGK